MKRRVSIMTLSLLTATTLANATPSEQMNFTSLNQSDSHMLFEKTPNSVIALGESEMRDTEGEWINFAVGGLYGAVGYAGSYLTSNQPWDWGNFAWSTLAGAATGGIGSGAVSFVRAYHTTKAAFFVGMGQGYYNRR